MKRVLFLLPLLLASEALAQAPAPFSNRAPARTVAGTKQNGLKSQPRSTGTDVTPACTVSCPPVSIDEGEQVCVDMYADNYNGGCNSDPPVFQNLTVSATDITVCGTYFTYGDGYRDTDWYQVVLTQPAQLNCTVDGEVPTQFALIDANAQGCAEPVFYWNSFIEPCLPTHASATVLPGVYWIFVAPREYAGVACGSQYTLTVNAQPPLATPIGSLHCNDINGVPLAPQQRYAFQGVVTGNFPTGTDPSQYSLQDDTGGFVVLADWPGCYVSLGDRVLVIGTLWQFGGLAELMGASTVIQSSGNPQPAPLDITLAQLNGTFQADYCEPNESRLVRIKNVIIKSASGAPLPPDANFTAQTNYQLVADDGTTGVLQIVQAPNRCDISNPLVGMTIPTKCPVDVTGIISQFDLTVPLSGGYMLWPRIPADIVTDCHVRAEMTTWGEIKAHYR